MSDNTHNHQKLELAATVTPMRNLSDTIEVLLLYRNPMIKFFGGNWVFPGGRVDAEDFDQAIDRDILQTSRFAAVREASEEASLVIHPSSLIPLSHWTTPTGLSKRYSTWVFITELDDQNNPQMVHVDGKEILDYQWLTPKHALQLHTKGQLIIPPPVFVTLTMLSRFSKTSDAITQISQTKPILFHPRFHEVPNGWCSLYEEDIAYHGGDLYQNGHRHRLWMLSSGWHYETRTAIR
ncbi:MAG: NUDIX hydrolase [Desulfobacterales bacterium]|nr:NUDIX hydrolase [Desulfobacterales bacterium]